MHYTLHRFTFNCELLCELVALFGGKSINAFLRQFLSKSEFLVLFDKLL